MWLQWPRTAADSARGNVPKLTKRTVESAKPADRVTHVWDDALSGFGLRVFPSGRRCFVLKCRAKGRQRWIKLGFFGELTPDQARRIAQNRLAELRAGRDPGEERNAARSAPTMRELAERYLRDHAVPKKKPSSVSDDRAMLRLYVVSSLGKRRVADVTRSDVDRLHASLSATPVRANRVLFLLSTMLNLAEKWDLRPPYSNPCRGVERYRENRRERFLSSAELARLGTALAEVEAAHVEGRDPRRQASELPAAVAALRLLILTGCRRGEVLGMQWEWIDFERRCVRLPDSKTGAKAVALNAPALAVLASLGERRGDSPWVIPGSDSAQPFVGLPKVWRRVRDRAGLADFRIHDLRHTHASVGIAAGLSLPLIGALLGHRQPSTTQRYAHLASDPLLEAAELVGARIAAALDARPEASVIPLRREGVAATR